VRARYLIATLVVCLALPAGAAAQTQGDVNVRLTPNAAGKASRLSLEVRGQAASYTGQELPRSASLFIARGFRIDPRARATRCSRREAGTLSCPKSSRIATGNAQGQVTFAGLGTSPFTASIEAFLAPPRVRGDIAGVVAVVRAVGEARSASGRLIPVAGPGEFGAELRFDDLNFPQPPAGTSARIDRLSLLVSAGRVVRKVKRIRRRVRTRNGVRIRRLRVVKRKRYHLITNPRSCSGVWPYQLRVGFPSSPEQVRDGSVTCSIG
jgi:hypothetical protein